jgi:hypothetical protein
MITGVENLQSAQAIIPTPQGAPHVPNPRQGNRDRDPLARVFARSSELTRRTSWEPPP